MSTVKMTLIFSQTYPSHDTRIESVLSCHADNSLNAREEAQTM